MSNNKNVSLLCPVAMLLVILAAVVITTPPTHAAEGEYTHYGPGLYGDFGVAVAPDPGFYLKNDLYYYKADASRERIVQYGEIRADIEMDTAMYMMTGLKVLDREVFGGRYAFGAFLQIVYSDISANVTLRPITA